MENGRQAPPGAISGRQLGDAAHRLVRNDLQSRTEPGHSPPSPCGMVPNGIPYSNGRHHHGNQWQAPSGVHANNGYLQGSTASHQHEQSSSVHSHFVTIQFNRSYNNNNLHYHRRDSRIDPRRVSPPVHVNNGYGYLPPPVPQIPVAGPYVQNPPRAYGGYQSYGSQQWQPRNDNSRVAYGDNSRRAYGNNSLQTNNRFSALSRGGSNCGPPPPPRPGYGRC